MASNAHESHHRSAALSVLEHVEDAVVLVTCAGEVAFVNDAFTGLLGWSLPDLTGEPIDAVVPQRILEDHGGHVQQLFTTAGRSLTRPARLPLLHKDGSEIEIDVVLSSLVVEGEQVVLATLRSTAPPEPLEPVSVLEGELLELLASGAPFDETTHGLLELIGSRLDFAVAALWVFDIRIARLRCTAFWRRAGSAFTGFERETMTAHVAPGTGLVGWAWQSREAVTTGNLGTDTRELRAPVAAHDGVRGGLAFPVPSDDGPIGVIELYGTTPGDPDAGLRNALGRISDELGRRLARRLAEEEATAERTRLEIALDASHMGVWEWDLRTNMVRWTEPLQTVLGRTGEFLGPVDEFAAILHPDERQAVLRAFLTAVDDVDAEAADAVSLEYRVVADDGEVRWVETRGRALRDEAGHPVLLTGVCNDVTDRKEADLRRESERARLHLALEAGGLGAWEWDPETDAISASPFLAELFGVDSATSMQSVMRSIHPDEHDQVQAEIGAAVEHDARVHFTHRVVGADATIRWVEGRGAAVRDSDGRIRAVTGVAGDVTVSRLSEMRAEGERARLQLALAAGGMGMWEWDVDSGHVEWSDRLDGLDRILEGEGTFTDWIDRIHPDDRTSVVDALHDAVVQRVEFVHEHRLLLPGTDVHWVETRGRPVVGAEGTLRVVGVVADVSTRKDHETRLRRKSRLLETLNDVGRAITAHLDLDEVVQMVTDAGRKLTGARFAAFFSLAHDGEDAFTVRALSGLASGHVRSLPAPRATHLFRRTVVEQEAVRIGDVSVHEDFGHNPPFHGLPPGHPPVRSYLAVPVVSGRGEVFGALLFGHHAPDRFDPSAERMATGLAAQAAVAIENARLYEAARVELVARQRAFDERDRVVGELQRSLLPPHLPTGPGIDLGARFRPGSGPVGGDFYDAFPLGEHDWGFVVGDVCGKGNEAAAVTALARHTVRTAAVVEPDPERVIQLLNDAVIRDETDRFCTAAFGRLRVTDGGASGVLVMAGHPRARILRAAGEVASVPDQTGMALGLVDAPPAGTMGFDLAPGDALVVFTDGVTEAIGAQNRFGDERLDHLLRSVAGRPAQAVADAVASAVETFEAGAGRDDVAILVVAVPS